MRRISAVATVCWLAIAAASAQEPKDLTARIVTWNIEGNRGIRSDSPPPGISDERAREIAVGMSYLDAEVFLLTEVVKTSVLDKLAGHLNSFGSEFNHALEEQQSGLNIAIMYKKGVQVDNVKLVDGTDGGDDGDRKALSAEVKIGNFDFLLVGLHLKSGRSNSSRKTRIKQADRIAEYIRNETADDEKDVIVLGDYNMIPDPSHRSNDVVVFDRMNPDRFLYFASSAELRGLGSHIRSGGYGNLLDGFAVSDVETSEYLEGSLRIYPLHRTMRKSLRRFSQDVSDHLPLVATFDIASDDDD